MEGMSSNMTEVAAECNEGRPMKRKRRDPIRELAIEIVEIFAGLLREEELRDAFDEVYDRIKRRLVELEGENAPAPSSRR